jgi:hypothetical protein
VIFEPLDFIAKLAVLALKPRINLTKFHGDVFAPNGKHQVQVTPAKRGKKPDKLTPPDTDWFDREPSCHDLDATTQACIQHRQFVHLFFRFVPLKR